MEDKITVVSNFSLELVITIPLVSLFYDEKFDIFFLDDLWCNFCSEGVFFLKRFFITYKMYEDSRA